MSYFPITRLRRTRQNKAFRSLVRETHITKEQLVYPLFITEGIHKAQEISAMPGIMQWSLKDIHKEIQRVVDLGITAVLLFGTPDKKDEVGSEAYNEKGITQQAIQTIKSIAPELLIAMLSAAAEVFGPSRNESTAVQVAPAFSLRRTDHTYVLELPSRPTTKTPAVG